MPTPMMTRMPAHPVLDLIDRLFPPGELTEHGIEQNTREYTEVVGISYREICRIRKAGTVTFATADRLCVHHGLHPAEVYELEDWGI